jgi:hypothetical protein
MAREDTNGAQLILLIICGLLASTGGIVMSFW